MGNAKAKHFWDKFSHDRALRHKIKCIYDSDRPYVPAAGLLEPKPEPVNEVPNAGHFSYRFRGDTMSKGD